MGRLTRRFALLALAALPACAGNAPPPERYTAGEDPCAVTAAGEVEAGRIVFGLAESVDPRHAPEPRNDAERVVFRNLYETLVTRGCDGLAPGLAASWASSEGGLVWTFFLRDGAEFWDGGRLTAYEVVESWEDLASVARSEWPRPSPWTDVNTIDARADGSNRIVVRLDHPDPGFEARVADPAFAVALWPGSGGWPLGSGPFRPLAGGDPDGGDLVCVPSGRGGAGRSGLSHVVFRTAPGSDPRDFASAGVDLFFLRDRDAIDELAGSFDFALTPLPADRLYVLLSRYVGGASRADPYRPGFSAADGALYSDARGELAWDVVASEAAPAVRFGFHESPADSCLWFPGRIDPNAIGGPPEGQRLVYRTDDPDARSIAERIAALAGWGRPPWSDHFAPDPAAALGGIGIEAVGLSSEDFEEALWRGRELGYVETLGRGSAEACRALDVLVGEAPWLSDLAADRQSVPWLAEDAAARLLAVRWVLPLIETRRRLVARRDLAGVWIDADGTPVLSGAGRLAPGEPAS